MIPDRSFRPFRRRAIFAAGVGLLLTLVLIPAARAEETEIFLTWHAPWGYPGATDTLSADCDTTGADTLWIAFKPGKAHPSFIAEEATLLFHPTPGETLSGWWYEVATDLSSPRLRLQFHPNPGLGYPQPFKSNGVGASRWDRVGASARLRLVYAVPYTEGAAIESRLLALGRIIVRQPLPTATACRQPVCIELADSRLAYYVGTDFEKLREGPHRFVSLNSPGGAIALSFRRTARLKPWRPKE